MFARRHITSFAPIALLLAALLQVGPVAAGTQLDPEITDPSDDSSGPIAEQDIVSVWIDDTPAATTDGKPALFFHIESAGDFEQAPSFFAASVRYRVSFVPSSGVPGGEAEAYIHISPSRASTSAVVTTVPNGPESVSCRFGTAAAGDSADVTLELAGEGILEGPNLFGCKLPLSFLPGFTSGKSLDSLAAYQQLVQRGPLSGGDNVGTNVIETFDTAPDTGFGRSFVFGGVEANAAGGSVLVETVRTPTFAIHHNFTAVQSNSYSFNWTMAPANVTVGLRVTQLNGTVTVAVKDAANKTVYERPATGAAIANFDVTGTAGTWKIQVTYAAFKGNLTLTLGPKAGPSTDTSSSTSGSGSATGTTSKTGTTGNAQTGPGTFAGSTSSSTSKGGPAPGWLAALGLLALVAWSARRRLA